MSWLSGGIGGALGGALGGGLLGGGLGAQVGGMLGLGGGGISNPFASPGTPPSPDYMQAAQAQGLANQQSALYTGQISNPNIQGILGGQNVTWQGNIPTVSQTLSPQQQALYNQQVGTQQQIGQNLQGALPQFQQAMQAPLGQDAGGYQQQATNAIMSRMQPQLQWQKEALDTQLANQGIAPGTEAWNRAEQQNAWQANDATQQAVLAGYGLGQQQLQSNIGLGQYAGQQMGNLLGQSAATIPQFQGFQGAQAQAAPIAQAAAQQGQYMGDVYNQQMAARNANVGGILGLGGALGMGALMSDIRSKENIVYLGKKDGYNVYEFEYKPEFRNRWGHGKHVGVIAQEVEQIKPDAVTEIDGYKAVDYGRL